MWHSVLNEWVYRLEIVHSAKTIINSKCEQEILDMEGKLKQKKANKKKPAEGAEVTGGTSSSSSSSKKKKSKKEEKKELSPKEKDAAAKAAKKAADKAEAEKKRKLAADQKKEEKELAKHNSTVTSAATRFLLPISAALSAAEEALAKPGALDMPALVVGKVNANKDKLAAWKDDCSNVLKAAAKSVSKKGGLQRLPDFELKQADVTSVCSEAQAAAKNLSQMLILASPK